MARKTGVSAVVLGKHLDVTNQWVGKLVKQGVLPKLVDGTFDLDRCRVAYIRHLRKEADRRFDKSATASRAQELKVRQLELNIAREEGELIAMSEIELTIQDILSTYVAELAGLAASCTRDVALRAVIEEKLDAAITRCRQRFTKAVAALSRGEEAVEDDAEDAA
jgi:hypothetical protein